MFHSPAISRVLTLVIAVALIPVATRADNLLLNPGAEQGKGENPSIWEQASVPVDGLKMERTTDVAKEGKASLMISNEHKYEKPVANNWMQSLQTVPHGATLRVAATIRTKDADSVNVCLQCWDSTGEKMLAFGSTPVVRGDQDWIRLTSGPVIVPAATASIIVRAALLGTGMVFFDELEVTSERTNGPENQTADADANASDADSGKASETDLAEVVKNMHGKLVQRVPVSKDCMVLAYMKEWNHGEVDNIGVANNDGGVRTLLAWKALPAKAIEGPNRRVLLAIYSRKTDAKPEASEIEISPISQKWQERTSWDTQPKVQSASDQVVVKTKFQLGDGWKFFNITPLLEKKTSANQNGVMLKFKEENQSGAKQDWSGYQFVSREGEGEWKNRRPQVLIIEAEKKDDSAEKK
jgi:hypothetical protein